MMSESIRDTQYNKNSLYAFTFQILTWIKFIYIAIHKKN